MGRDAPAPRLLARAVELVRSGTLPDGGASGTVLAGPGEDNRCSLCADPIKASDVEYEMTVPAQSGATQSFYFHIPCYHAWKRACPEPFGAGRETADHDPPA